MTSEASGTDITSYDLDLNVDFGRAFVRGTVLIKLKDSEPSLKLDAVSLEVKGVRVNGGSSQFTLDKNAGLLTVTGVPSGQTEVEIDYEKQVSDDVIFGLYKSKYGSEYFLVTDLEPAEARTVFPCKDDPAHKAVFNVKVTTDKELGVIFNTPIESQEVGPNGTRTTVFRPTPRMSTYLFFLGIGRFEQTSLKTKTGEVIVATRPRQKQRTGLVRSAGAKLVKAYGDYFGIPYPLEKLHLVALPEYHTGAMENWGAIASREAYLLLDKNSSTFDKRHAVYVVSHEIAHQWFGDLVTMKWWDDLWLNESFATFMGYKILDRLHPDWEMWGEYLRRETLLSLRADSLKDTHPIQVHVADPKEASQVFDAVSYGKGASVLRMIEGYLGEDAFRKGVSDYLRRFQFSNARGEDLWKALETASGQPISRIMEEWIKRPGFPVVKVSLSKTGLKLTQKRFFLSGEEGDEVWPIPLVLNLNGKRKSVLFDRESMEIPSPKVTKLKLNPQLAGFYAVLYDDKSYDIVARTFRSLPAVDRLGVMSDLFLFVQAGKVPPEQYFRFLHLCRKETDQAVLGGIADHLLRTLYPVAADIPAVRKQLADFAISQLKRLGMKPKKGEDPLDSFVRGEMAILAALTDDKTAKRLASQFDDYGKVSPDMREAVVIAYAHLNGSTAYDRLLKMLKTADSEVDREKLYRGVTAFREPKLVEKMMDLGISGQVSRSDSAYTLVYSAANPYARDVAWQWVKRSYKRLWEIYGGSQQFLLYMEAITPLCGLGHESDVAEFLSSKMEDGRGPYRRAIERLATFGRLRKTLSRMKR